MAGEAGGGRTQRCEEESVVRSDGGEKRGAGRKIIFLKKKTGPFQANRNRNHYWVPRAPTGEASTVLL